MKFSFIIANNKCFSMLKFAEVPSVVLYFDSVEKRNIIIIIINIFLIYKLLTPLVD